MAAEDELRLTFSFKACLGLFTTASGKKKSLIIRLKWQKQRMTPSKIMESLLYAGFMQLFFNSKKKKKVESFEKALDFQPVTLYDLG